MKHIWLGGADDPKPVFRDEQPGELEWPEGAVMAAAFDGRTFTNPSDADQASIRIEFFDSSGWPCDLSAVHRNLPADIRRELQVFPWPWRTWTQHTWHRAEHFPHNLAHARTLFGLSRVLASVTERLAP